ncbi:DUF2076 domain-containing protein [Aquabacter cavernae]|uniref:DUF2076 domain-containing protein n=1 Tax=Aquabacter cavernae TaxID=2496029 RepID=UPI000F8CAE42|nr:DUF2076 domain-containing protein [Aquabacter cavernae]
MTPDERSLIDGLFDRLKGTAGQPRDGEAEALIARRVQDAPYAPYALAQTVLVQDHALQQAYARIQELEEQARTQAQPAAPAGAGSFLGSLLGGRGTSVPSTGNRAMPLPQQSLPPQGSGYTAPGFQQGGGYTAPGYPQGQYAQGGMPQGGYPQQAAPGPWGGQRGGFGGGGFLQGALATAAGVAGGALLVDGIRNVMSSGTGPIAEQAAALDPAAAAGDLGQQAQNALGGDALGGNPWGAGGQDASAQDAGFVDDGSQDTSAQDASFDDGGWDSGGGGDDSSWT